MKESTYESLKEHEIKQLLNLLYMGHGNPWWQLTWEIPDTKGVMMQGYASLRGFYPDYIGNLDELVTKKRSDGGLTVTYIDPPHYWHLSDAIEKFGFMLLARDALTDAAKREVLPFCQYNFYCFVFLTKAFLDAISLFLNEELHLGMSGGQVDITKKHFFDKLEQASGREPLAQQLSGFYNWLSFIARYRIDLIHRRPAQVFGREVPRSAPPKLRRHELHVPLQPTFISEGGWKKSKEIGEFASEWLKQAEGILKAVCTDCLNELSKQSK